jgi:hypothetical protein
MQVIFTLISAALLQAPADTALEPWASKALPGDIGQRYLEEISQAEHTYTVVHGGTVDGECCRTPMGCGINSIGKASSTKAGSPTAQCGWKTWARPTS